MPKKELIVILPVTKKTRDSAILSVIKANKEKNIAYITLGRSHEFVRALIEKNKVETANIIFVDGTGGKAGQSRQCYFIIDPSSFAEISKFFAKFLRHNFEIFIFDAIDDLFREREKYAVLGFLHEILGEIKDKKREAILVCIDKKQKDIVKKLVDEF